MPNTLLKIHKTTRYVAESISKWRYLSPRVLLSDTAKDSKPVLQMNGVTVPPFRSQPARRPPRLFAIRGADPWV